MSAMYNQKLPPAAAAAAAAAVPMPGAGAAQASRQQQQLLQQGRHPQHHAPVRKPPAPAPVPLPAARAAQQPLPAYAPGAAQAPPDFDVEAVALSAIGASGMTDMGIDEDGIMAMALGTLEDPPHQDWNVSSQSAICRLRALPERGGRQRRLRAAVRDGGLRERHGGIRRRGQRGGLAPL